MSSGFRVRTLAVLVPAMWAMTLWSHDLLPIQWGAVISASLVAATTDVVSRKIPNRLTGPLLLTGLIWGLAIGGLAGLADSIAGCLMLAFPFVLLFIFAGGGAGDAKLLGAIGSWLGLASGAVTLAAVCISGLFLALIFALSAGRLRLTLRNVVTRMRAMLVGLCTGTADLRASRSQAVETQTLPYGLAIATGTILAAVGVFRWHI